MNTVRLLCPNCSSPDFEPTQLDPNRCRCRHCGSYFGIKEAKHTGGGASNAGRSASANAGMGVVLIAFAVTALLIAGGVAAFFLTKKPRSSRSTYSYVPPKTKPPKIAEVDVVTEPVEPEKEPEAKVRAVSHAEQSGYEVWIGEVENTGEIPVDRPCARVLLKDAKGEVIADERGYVPRAALGPGQVGPFRISAKKRAYAKWEAALCDLRKVTYGPNEAPAKVVEHKLSRGDFGSNSVIGTVENDGDAALKFVQIVMMGRDANGALVSVDEGYADTELLKPGARARFKVMVGIFETGKVAKYEAYATGMPQ